MTESYGDLQEYKGPRRITIYTADLCPWMLRIDNGPQYIYVYIFRASAAGTGTEARMTALLIPALATVHRESEPVLY
jgi:hypothetical protein